MGNWIVYRLPVYAVVRGSLNESEFDQTAVPNH